MTTTQSKRWWWIAGALLCLGLWGAGSWAFWMTRGETKHAERYNELAMEAQTEPHARPARADGQPWAACEAAPAYQEALGLCEGLPQTDLNDLDRLLNAAGPSSVPDHKPVQKLPDFPLRRPGEQPIPEACLALGVPPDAQDTLSAQLTEPLCAELLRCGPAMDKLVAATRCRDARSPLYAYDPWSLSPDHKSTRPLPHVLHLGKLLVARAALQRDRPKALGEQVAALRFGRDMAQGGSLLGVLLGVGLQNAALRPLRGHLERDDLTEEARLVLAELASLPPWGSQRRGALRSEVLLFGPSFFRDQAQIKAPPGAVFVMGTPTGARERIVFGLTRADMFKLWDDLLSLQARPLPERLTGYVQIDQRAQSSINPMLSAMSIDYSGYDLRIVGADARLDLLRCALVDALTRKGGAPAPTALGQLPPPCAASPDHALRLDHDAQGRRLCSDLTEDQANPEPLCWPLP